MIAPHDRLTGLPGSPSEEWTGRWALGSEHLLDPVGASTSRDETTSDDLDAVASLAEILAAAVQEGSWLALTEVPLLARHDNDALELEKRERILEEHLASIARVCEQFITRLGEHSELLPVSRVKRPARRALERMAAHTEDWAARTLSGPVPRRALAVTRDHDADLYENRMVTELVHPILSSALSTRIRQLHRLTSDLADLARAEDQGTYRRKDRLYSFWGADAVRASETSDRAECTVKKLEAMAARIQSLRGSTLATTLRGRRTGQRSLRMTNVISNDRHYRAAGLVWSAYERTPESAESPDERIARYRLRQRAFDDYALGLIIRSLDQLGYEPASDDLPAAERPLVLHGRWGQAEILRNDDGSVVLSSHGTCTRFVPLIDLLAPGDDHAVIVNRWKGVTDAVTVTTVVLHLAPSAAVNELPSPLARAMASAGPDGANGGLLVSGVPVSPLETTSLERVARAVALAIYSPALQGFPRTVHFQDEHVPRRLVRHILESDPTQRGLSPLFHSDGLDTLAVRRSMTTNERAKFDSIVRQLTDRAKSPGWEKDFVREIGEFSSAIKDAEKSVAQILSCPLCPVVADTTEVTREADVFSVTCRACGCRWGLERCGKCRARIPIIEPERGVRNPEVYGPGWVERIYGQDALASPCWARKVPGKYVCSGCGACAEMAISGSDCLRCTTSERFR